MGSHLGGHGHTDGFNAGNRTDSLLSLVAELIFDRAGRRRQLDGKRDSIAAHLEVLDEPQRHDIPVKVRVNDLPKRIEKPFLDQPSRASIRNSG